MANIKNKNQESGISVIEVLLAAAIFVLFAVGVGGVVLGGLEGNRLGEEQTIASQYASEGIEAARSIKNQAFTNLVNSAGTGVAVSGGVWTFSGVNNQFGPSNKYTRVLTVSDIQRDCNGNIVTSGGISDPSTKKATSTVSWNFTPTRPDSVVLSTYFTNWKSRRGGMLVYGDGGTTTDAIKYRILDPTTQTWGTATATADVDAGTTNRALRAARLYSASVTGTGCRNEKILLSRHYDGSVQYIYAQVWNGTTWGNVQLLSSWTANTFLDVQNFDGTYLSNGNFMVVYSDNTAIPKMRTWNGTTWSAQSSLTSLGNSPHFPNFINIAARPGTSEVMAAFFDQAKATITQYWNGSAWSAITTHSTNAFQNTIKGMEFAWSTHSPTIGGIVYMTGGGDKVIHGKLFQADGLGSGTWGTETNSATQPNVVKLVSIAPRSTADEFQTCDKDSSPNATITCFKITFSGTTMTWTTPTNNLISSASQNGLQTTFGLRYESTSGDPGLIVYSDNTSTPKFKKYTASTTTWDAAATSITTTGTPGIFQTIRVISIPVANDMMVLMADANMDLYSVLWDGTNNVMYTTPVGDAFSAHGVNGSATTDYWYDFVWDSF